MPLDPQVRAILDQMIAGGLPPIHTMAPPQARAMFDMTATMLDAKNIPIGATVDRTLPGPAGPIPIRVYTPVDAPEGPLPALVFIHGGGFVIGSLKSHDVPCRLIANKSGFRVIAVDYRLGPEHRFPAAVEDCLAAVKWVAANAAELGIDPARIAVGGDSAGGNLTAVVTQLAREAGGEPAIAFQLLIYPTVDATVQTPSRKDFAKGYFLEVELMEWFFKNYISAPADAFDTRVSPLKAATLAGLPPAHIITAGFDPLRDEGAAYAEKLREAGVPVTLVNEEGMIHGFWNMTGVITRAGASIDEACEAMKKALA